MINQELSKIAREIVALSTDMSGERMTKLFLAFESWAVKKGATLPASAPVGVQIVKGISNVRNALSGKMNLTGEEAVKTFIKAMKKDFTMDANPIPSLIKKYGREKIQDMFYSRTAKEVVAENWSQKKMENFLSNHNKTDNTNFYLGSSYGQYELWANDTRLDSGSLNDVYQTWIKYRFNPKCRK